MSFCPKVPKELQCLGEVRPVDNSCEGAVTKDVVPSDGGPTIITEYEKPNPVALVLYAISLLHLNR